MHASSFLTAGAVAATALIGPTGSPVDAAEPHSQTDRARPSLVQVSAQPRRLDGQGRVRALFWVRCRAGLNAFELDVTITQPHTAGSTTRTGAGQVACDGTRQRVLVGVQPSEAAAPFRAGRAHIEVYVGLYDPVTDRDSEARDGARVRVLAPR